MKVFSLRISSPEGDLFSGECAKLCLRCAEGDLAVMAGHIPFVSTVLPCICRIELDNGEARCAKTAGGLLNVTQDQVLLLSGSFQWTE